MGHPWEHAFGALQQLATSPLPLRGRLAAAWTRHLEPLTAPDALTMQIRQVPADLRDRLVQLHARVSAAGTRTFDETLGSMSDEDLEVVAGETFDVAWRLADATGFS